MDKKIAAWVVVALIVGGGVGVPIGKMICDHSSDHAAVSLDSKKVALDQAMRVLWGEHMQWTYSTVDAFFNDQATLQPTLNRLLQNQKDIGAAIVPYYGQAAGDKLAALLTTHIQDAVPVLTAAKANDTAGLNTAVANWQANAKDIADFLSTANPTNWPKSATEPMMKEHIDQTITYSVDILKGNTTQAIVDYQKAYDHMMQMSDVLANGIAAQFPSKVSGTVAATTDSMKM